MKINRGLLVIVTLLVIALAVHSCKKDDKEKDEPTSNANWVSDDALAQKTFDDIQSIANEAYARESKSPSKDTVFISSCAAITLDLSVFPYKLIIDFGTTNCLCSDNKYRRGKIITTFNGAYSDSGTVIRDTLDNYYVNDHKVEGVKVVTNRGHIPVSGHILYQVSVNGRIIKPNNGGTITWTHNGEREWVAGYNTWNWLDDVYLVSGTSNGVAANSQSYTLTTITPLVIKLNCPYITSGIMSFQGEGLSVITVDYGDGTCDNVAMATYLGQTITIYM